MNFLLLLLISLFLCFPVAAQQNPAAMVSTPWDESARSLPDTLPAIKPLRLSDLQDLADFSDPMPDKKEPRKTKASPSRIEAGYATRIVDELQQFGYDFFTPEDQDSKPPSIPAGAVQNDYILSAGDSLRILLRGQVNLQQTVEIDQNGQLIVEDLTPIPAAGRTLGAVEADLRTEIKALHNTQIFISLATIRQIGVLVAGHVHKPGRKTLTAFHTVLDALGAAGGIQKDGSLRQIKLVRGGKTHLIDLYQMMIANGGGADRLLQDGDRLIIPPIGETLAISGSVKRPGIYEIRNGEQLSLYQLLGLAGGVLMPGQNRMMKLEVTQEGEEIITDVTDPKIRQFSDGAVLIVARSEEKKIRRYHLKRAYAATGDA